MLTERYESVVSKLKDSNIGSFRESIFFDIETAALATTNHLIEAHFDKNVACCGSEDALVDSILLLFQTWDLVGYNDRSCQEWVLRSSLRYLRQAINNIDYISRKGISNRGYIDSVRTNTKYQGFAIMALKCLTIEDLRILCRQYPQIIKTIELKYNGYTSKFGRGNPLDSILERLKGLR
jgi:hypothetical protein